jgi:NitT/TauT family transport system substrate-binding protein
VKTIADFTEADRIAVPTIRVGTQPAVLGIAVEKQFDLGQVERYNSLTVSLGHPDAMIALQAKGGGGVRAHFSQPPYQNQELKIPGVHTVLNSFDVVGGGMTNGCFYSTTDFRHKNPVVIKALVEAIKEAVELVKTDRKRGGDLSGGEQGEHQPRRVDRNPQSAEHELFRRAIGPASGGAILLTRRLHQAEADGLERVLLSRSA